MKKSLLLLIIIFCVQQASAQTAIQTEKNENKFSIAIQGGFGYRLAKISGDTPPVLDDYAKDMKSGYSLSLDFAYFIEKDWGLGIKYSRFSSEESLENISVTYLNGFTANGNISDNILISFIGPSYIFKYQIQDSRHSITGAVSLGYLAYKDEAVIVDQTLKIFRSHFWSSF